MEAMEEKTGDDFEEWEEQCDGELKYKLNHHFLGNLGSNTDSRFKFLSHLIDKFH